jgi:type VI secretion system VasI family protein
MKLLTLAAAAGLAMTISANAQDSAQWEIEKTTSKLDRSTGVVASLRATEASVSGRPVQAALIIRCHERQTNIYIGFSTMAGGSDGVRVQYRIGETAPATASWSTSEDFRGYGLWDTKRAIPLIQKLATADEFYVRGEARIAGSSEALFKLTGIADAAKTVREACKW